MPYPHWAKTGENGQKRAKTGANRRKLFSGDGVKTGENGLKREKTDENWWKVFWHAKNLFANIRQFSAEHEISWNTLHQNGHENWQNTSPSKFCPFSPVLARFALSGDRA